MLLHCLATNLATSFGGEKAKGPNGAQLSVSPDSGAHCLEKLVLLANTTSHGFKLEACWTVSGGVTKT